MTRRERMERDAVTVTRAVIDVRGKVGLDGYVLGLVTELVSLCVSGECPLSKLIATIESRYAIERDGVEGD